MYIVLILMNPFTSFWPGIVIAEIRILAFTRYCQLQQRPGLGETSKANMLTVFGDLNTNLKQRMWSNRLCIHVHVNVRGRTAEHNAEQ